MRPQRKIMMVETTHAFVKLKQIKAAVSAGGIKFELTRVFISQLTTDRRSEGLANARRISNVN